MFTIATALLMWNMFVVFIITNSSAKYVYYYPYIQMFIVIMIRTCMLKRCSLFLLPDVVKDGESQVNVYFKASFRKC